ncbi:MAG: Rid family detoxifying hydrolase [Desulfarculus sp.]|nr:Rid family detoxifying hydrolase [Desulfarculus sp.]
MSATITPAQNIGPYSSFRWAGDLCFLSGRLGLRPETGELAGADTATQTAQAMRNLHAGLLAAGLDWPQVVKTTVFLIDMSDFAVVNQVYAEYFQDSPEYPARSCVQVAGLPKPGARVEIEAVACRA